jgi:hypothetical protein
MADEIVPLLFLGNITDATDWKGAVVPCLFDEGELREEEKKSLNTKMGIINTIIMKCRKCGAELVPGENVTPSWVSHGNYICRVCFNEWRRENYKKSGKYIKQRYYLKHREEILEKARLYRERNRELLRQRDRERYKTQREKRREIEFRSKYGISRAEADRLREQQGGLCPICHKPLDAFSKNQYGKYDGVVDHDHKTGRIRGIICSRCNSILGFAQDSIEILESAISYLRRFKGD